MGAKTDGRSSRLLGVLTISANSQFPQKKMTLMREKIINRYIFDNFPYLPTGYKEASTRQVNALLFRLPGIAIAVFQRNLRDKGSPLRTVHLRGGKTKLSDLLGCGRY